MFLHCSMYAAARCRSPARGTAKPRWQVQDYSTVAQGQTHSTSIEEFVKRTMPQSLQANISTYTELLKNEGFLTAGELTQLIKTREAWSLLATRLNFKYAFTETAAELLFSGGLDVPQLVFHRSATPALAEAAECNFAYRRCNNIFTVDKSQYIHTLHTIGRGSFFLFLRPKRFGKSAFLSLLEYFYDLSWADEFERLFGPAAGLPATAVYAHKDELPHNQFLILKWNFAAVNRSHNQEVLRRELTDHINISLELFLRKYGRIIAPKFGTEELIKATIHNSCVSTMESVFARVVASGKKIVLLVDEYDAISNEFVSEQTKDVYLSLGEQTSLLKAIFAKVKEHISGAIQFAFATGVAPLALADHTSGLNVVRNVTHHQKLEGLCGLSQLDVKAMLAVVASIVDLPATELEQGHLKVMEEMYNGYRFTRRSPATAYYCTDLALQYGRLLLEELPYNRDAMPDAWYGNTELSHAVLEIFARHPHGSDLMLQALSKSIPISIPTDPRAWPLEKGIRMEDLIDIRRLGDDLLLSLAFHFGALTYSTEGDKLVIPNSTVENDIVRRARQYVSLVFKDEFRVTTAVKELLDNRPERLSKLLEEKLQAVSGVSVENQNELLLHSLCHSLFERYHDLHLREMEFAFHNGWRFAYEVLITAHKKGSVHRQGIVLEFKNIALTKMDMAPVALRNVRQRRLLNRQEKLQLVKEVQDRIQALPETTLMQQLFFTHFINEMPQMSTVQEQQDAAMQQAKDAKKAYETDPNFEHCKWSAFAITAVGSCRIVVAVA
eukprot:TRINITY_DN24517_c0_g1_i1.p1 TRINITY_DN24517_c0_g1~~TRINITY_DN24517_c0_g1_i1.p1  ORF type:complete len:781 (+),score=139.68 TRINITY_DN24517_c0_g1_i1:278-2620(+)